MNNMNFLLALNRIPTVGPRTVAKLLKRWPDLKNLFALPIKDLEEAGLPFTLAQAIGHFNFKRVEEDLRWAAQPDQYILTWESDHYPSLLTEIHDPPVVLYAKGNINAFKKTALAMVGTRKPSIIGAENAYFFAKSLAELDISVISGLALGVDAKAHQGCLAAQGATVAVLGTGIDCIYPRRHHDLAEKILENGLLVSEFPLKSPPIAGHFPRRNRIISGLSLVTLVIEAAIRSGSLITARFALEQNRDVLALPGSIHNPQASGCNLLLQQGARLVTSMQDILEAIDYEKNSQATEKTDNITKQYKTEKNQGIKKTSKQSFSEKTLLQYIGFETTSVDDIVKRTQNDLETITCELAMLELQGLIQAVTGGYMRCKQ